MHISTGLITNLEHNTILAATKNYLQLRLTCYILKIGFLHSKRTRYFTPEFTEV